MEQWITPEERRRFIESQGIAYLPRAEYTDQPSFKRDLKDSPYYLDNQEEFDHLAVNYGKAVAERQMAPVSIRFVSGDVGCGLFAESDLEAGSFIGEYTGTVQPGRDVLPEEKGERGYDTDYTWDYPDAWYEDILFEINAGRRGNELRYINHSFEPNLAVEHTLLDNRWVIFFVAGQFIPAGTQLTVDYGEEYWSGGFRELVLF